MTRDRPAWGIIQPPGSKRLHVMPVDAAAAPVPLRYGIVLEASAVDAWQSETIDRLERSGAAELVLVVMGDRSGARRNAPPAPRRSSGPGRILGRAAFLVFAAYVSRSRALRPAGRVPWSDDVSILRVSGGRKPSGSLFQNDDLTTIRAHRLDFLIWYRAETPTDDVVETARHGVWSFHFGQRLDRGVPAGFWELVDGQPVVGATLRRSMASAGPVMTLRTGWFAAAPESYARTRDRLYMGVADWPTQVCREILLGASQDPQASPGPQGPRRPLDLRHVVRFLAVIARARLQKHWHHGMRHDDWNIGVADAPVESIPSGAAMRDVTWAPVHKGHYSADPFGLWQDGGLQILYEDYSHARGAASIARRRWTREGGWEPPEPALDIGSHLSYPFMIEYEGRLLLLPESRASGEVVLYEADRVDGAWRPLVNLGLGVDVADATLLQHDGTWWLFAVRSDWLNPATELHIWFADRPEGPWREHPLNPVLVDVRSARPAGPFFRADGQLYRPAQDCSTGYGDRLAIKRVVTLTRSRYEEELVRFLEAEPHGPFRHGFHTLTGVGDVTLVDGKRRVWSTAATARAIRGRLRP